VLTACLPQALFLHLNADEDDDDDEAADNNTTHKNNKNTYLYVFLLPFYSNLIIHSNYIELEETKEEKKKKKFHF
jgi:hypothetical protein